MTHLRAEQLDNPPIIPVLIALNAEFADEHLKDYGKWHPVRCAFHGDRHASASYNPTENVYKCHVCGIAGDAYEIVKEVEKVDFPTAKRRVQDITGDSGGPVRGEPGGGGGRSRLLGGSGDSTLRRQRISARGGSFRRSSPRR